MSGLCGWAGWQGDDATAHGAAWGMMSALPVFEVRHRRFEMVERSALGFAGADAGAWFTDEDVTCAIDGTPNWNDPALEALARRAGDGAALAEAWYLFGAELTDRLSGDFVLAVVDRRRREAFVTIDRTGLHPLAYRNAGGRLIFGSTIDAVRAHPDVDASLSSQALFDFFHLSVIPAPDTAYQGIRKLRPGEYLHWRNGLVLAGFYWEPPFVQDGAREIPALALELKSLLRQSVNRSMRGVRDEDLGIFLSGGLDSSTVAGLAAGISEKPVECFTIGFDQEEFDERRYAEIAARHFHATHHTYDVTPADTADSIPDIAAAYDEPFGNSSCVPTYHCARIAREHGVSVMLAGDGGDEIFAGNSRYVLQQKFDLYHQVPAPLRRLIEPALLSAACASVPLLRKVRGYVNRARIPMPDRMEAYNYLTSETCGTVFEPDFLASINSEGPMEAMRGIYARSTSPSLLQRMLHFDMQITLADNDLRKVKRMTELAGVAVRFPFLDDQVVEFAAAVRPDLLISRLRLRHFYKEAMRGFLPPEIIAKTKHGFGLPFRVWLHQPGPLRDVVVDSIDGLKRRGIVRPALLDSLLAQRDGEEARRYGSFLWYAVILEQWLRTRDCRAARRDLPNGQVLGQVLKEAS